MLLEHDTRYGLKLSVDSAVRRRLGIAQAVRPNPNRKKGSFGNKWSDTQIRQKIAEAAMALGKDRITHAEYSRYVQSLSDANLFPSRQTVRRCSEEFVR